MEGELLRYNVYILSWRERVFKLEGNKLSGFKKGKLKECYNIVGATFKDKKKLKFDIHTSAGILRLKAKTVIDKMHWINAFKASEVHMNQEKKKKIENKEELTHAIEKKGSNLNPEDHSPNIVRILSLDGGGIRGVGVARVLHEIEKSTGKKISELFNFCVGTSTGGIITLLLTVPSKDGTILSAKETIKLYTERAKDIFEVSKGLKNPFATKSSGSGMLKVISHYFHEDTRMKDAIIPVGVVSTDIQRAESILINSFKAKLFPDDYRNNVHLSQAARATSAAPIFFPPIKFRSFREKKGEDVKIEEKKRAVSPDALIHEDGDYARDEIVLEDGGTSTNNPSMMALDYAISCLKAKGLNPADYQFQMISIGTGTLSGKEEDPTNHMKYWNKEDSFKGKFGAIGRLFLDDLLSRKKKAHGVHLKTLKQFGSIEGPGSNYYRVQFLINKHQATWMDDCSDQNMMDLIQAAEGYLFEEKNDHSPHFNGLISVLKAPITPHANFA